MPRRRRSILQLEEIVDDPRRALADSRYWSEPLCHRFLDHVAESVHRDPRAALPMAIIGVRLAFRVERQRRQRRIRNRCLLTRAWGVLGTVYRLTGRPERAASTLTKAAKVARQCLDPDLRSDVRRRQAILALDRSRRADGTFAQAGLREASEFAEVALREARGPLAVARATIARGVISVYSGEPAAAAAEARRALELIDATRQPYDHISALTLLVHALTQGDAADRDEAVAHLKRLRGDLPHRVPEIRARLLWAEALLHVPNRRRKARARRLLDQARRRFVRLGIRAEAVAVTAELARLDPEGEAVPGLCADLLPLLGNGPLRELVERLRAAPLPDRAGLAEALRGLVRAPGILPAMA